METTQIEAVTGSIRKYVAIFISALALLNTWPSAALAQTAAGGLFSIENHAGFSDNHVAHVTSELETGIRALKALGVPLRTEKFPITVHLKRGRGISRSYHGRGPIVLHRVAGRRSPIIHELTHMLAGYTWSHGHWTTEGFASYMQDKYGKDIAYPTRRLPHELMRLILEENSALPMLEVMRDRRRKNFFGKGNLWHRFLAYAQSSSFCKYLIDTHGITKFLAIYDKPFEEQDFQPVYGQPAPALVTAWHTHIHAQRFDLDRARQIYRNIRNFTR